MHLTSPASGLLTRATSLTLQGTASDDLGVPTVEYSLDQGASWTAAPVTSGTFSATPALPTLDGAALTLRVRATDSANQVATDQVDITVDNVAPQLAIGVPTADQLFGPGDFGAPFATGTVSDGSGAATVSVDLDDGNGPTAAAVTSGNWSIARAAPTGEDYVAHTLTATASDPAGNTTQATVRWYADVVAPRLTLTAPTLGQKFNASAFGSTSDVTVTWTVADGDPTLVVTSPQKPGLMYTPPANSFGITTSASDNPQSYPVSLSAVTRKATTSASVTFSVDRVRPTASAVTPADQSRNDAPVATVTTSEPVSGGDALVLSPAAGGGSWNAGRTVYTSPALAHDTVYSADTNPALLDDYGNPVVAAATVHFHTAPALATNGFTLATSVSDFQATTDGDGVLAVFVHDTAGGYALRAVDSKTGAVATLVSFNPASGITYSNPMVYASSYLNGLAARRLVADSVSKHQTSPALTTNYVNEFFNDGSSANLSDLGLIPLPAFGGEGTGLGEYGFLNLSPLTYQRTGRADVATTFSVFTALQYSSSHWVLTDFATPRTQLFGCVYDVVGHTYSCGVSGVSLLNDATVPGGQYSLASGGGCDLHSYQTGASQWTTHGFCHANTNLGSECLGGGFSENRGSPVSLAVNRADETSFVGATYTSSALQLLTRTVGAKCTAGTGWSNSGSALAVTVSSGTANPVQAVLIGGKPGAVYLDSSGNLKLYLP